MALLLAAGIGVLVPRIASLPRRAAAPARAPVEADRRGHDRVQSAAAAPER